jgi:lysophospholipase L1-like esterase
MKEPRRHVSLSVVLLLVCASLSFGQAADPDPARFADAIDRFAQWDSQNAAPARSVLFVGSSSIVRWPTADRFPGLPVVNRGFGGSHISDVNHFIEQTVLRYAAEVIVFYAGNNDINSGKSAVQVADDYRAFVGTVLARKPGVRILFISIHPSLQRWERWPEMREANALIKAYSAGNPALHYVDVATPMLGQDGRPIPNLFVEDGLHLTPAGYDLWTPIVARAIESIRADLTTRR